MRGERLYGLITSCKKSNPISKLRTEDCLIQTAAHAICLLKRSRNRRPPLRPNRQQLLPSRRKHKRRQNRKFQQALRRNHRQQKKSSLKKISPTHAIRRVL